MGCVASKLEEEEKVVSICRDRRRQIKLAVERRSALAEAHSRYCHALYAVAAAIGLFVSRHSSPSSPFLITFPPPSTPATDQNEITKPLFLKQKHSESTTTTQESMACESFADDSSSSSSDFSEEEKSTKERMEREQNLYHGYFYMQQQIPPPMPSPQRDFGWDFFNPFDGMRTEVISGYRRSSDDDLKRVREEEGIPELEEEVERDEGEKKVLVAEKNGKGEGEESCFAKMEKLVDGNANGRILKEQKGLTVIDCPEEGRELLEALKDIEDYFIRAYASGKDVSRMLEANHVLQSGLEGIKGRILLISSSFVFIFSLY